jgi:hypothetical protein
MEIREPLLPGNIYHVCTKANGVDMLFRDSRDYTYFKRKMTERLTEAWEVLAYTLVPNEIHLVVKIAKAEIDDEEVNHSILFGHLLNGYVQHYNHVHGRSGSLLNRSFRRELLKTENDLKNSIVKIHNLPVARKLVTQKHKWNYSSYKEHRERKLSLNQIAQLMGMFGDFIRYELLHFCNSLLLENILPARKWLKVLSPAEVEFRKQHPLGGHRWSRRAKPPP